MRYVTFRLPMPLVLIFPPKRNRSPSITPSIHRLQIQALQVDIVECSHIDSEKIGVEVRILALREATHAAGAAKEMSNLVLWAKSVLLHHC